MIGKRFRVLMLKASLMSMRLITGLILSKQNAKSQAI